MTKSVSATIDGLLSLRADDNCLTNWSNGELLSTVNTGSELPGAEMAVARAEATAYGHAL